MKLDTSCLGNIARTMVVLGLYPIGISHNFSEAHAFMVWEDMDGVMHIPIFPDLTNMKTPYVFVTVSAEVFEFYTVIIKLPYSLAVEV